MMLLCDSFPSLYTLAESKEVWDYLGEEDGRNLQFIRLFNDRKVDVVEGLVQYKGRGIYGFGG